jgi:hypothetical protein
MVRRLIWPTRGQQFFKVFNPSRKVHPFKPQMPSAGRRKNGRPTKRTEVVLKPLFEAIRIGVPYKLACMAAGISYDCFANWRREDPAFDAEVEQAAAQSAVKLFKTIRAQAPETWQAGAWCLERRYAQLFAKPESQLQLNVVAQAAAQGPTNVVIVGPQRAELLATRVEQIRAKSRELIDKVCTRYFHGRCWFFLRVLMCLRVACALHRSHRNNSDFCR